MEGTQTLASLWLWLCDVARSSEPQEPLAVHSRSGDRDGWGSLAKPDRRPGDERPPTAHEQEVIGTRSRQVIRGLPFSRSFTRRVDRELPRAVREALDLLKSDPSLPPMLRTARRAQYRIVAAVLRDGHTDRDECRRQVGMSVWAFNVAADSGIRALQAAMSRD